MHSQNLLADFGIDHRFLVADCFPKAKFCGTHLNKFYPFDKLEMLGPLLEFCIRNGNKKGKFSETKELFKGSSLGNNIGSSIQSAPGDKSTPALNRRRGDLREIYWIIIYQVGVGVFFPPSTKAFIFITKAHRLYCSVLFK